MKQETMNFEVNGVRVIQTFETYQGLRYTDPIHDAEDTNVLYQLYQLIVGQRYDFINPTVDGYLNWKSI